MVQPRRRRLIVLDSESEPARNSNLVKSSDDSTELREPDGRAGPLVPFTENADPMSTTDVGTIESRGTENIVALPEPMNEIEQPPTMNTQHENTNPDAAMHIVQNEYHALRADYDHLQSQLRGLQEKYGVLELQRDELLDCISSMCEGQGANHGDLYYKQQIEDLEFHIMQWGARCGAAVTNWDDLLRRDLGACLHGYVHAPQTTNIVERLLAAGKRSKKKLYNEGRMRTFVHAHLLSAALFTRVWQPYAFNLLPGLSPDLLQIEEMICKEG
jgi:hypothetical protein